MLRKSISCLAAAVCCFGCLIGTAAAAEVEAGDVYCFCAEDFSADPSITGICITEVQTDSGVLQLDSRILQPGDILTAEQVSRMTFSASRCESDRTAEVGYLPIYKDHVDKAAAMTLSIRGKEDKAPVAEDSAAETYKNLPNTEKLKVSDPEGQAMTFTLTRQPRRGTVELHSDGSFTYTPKKNKVGVDSFVYTAADPAGNVSREATVTVTILKPSDAPQYSDTLGKDCRFAAEWMKHTGIFVGETLGEQSCFGPDKQVTRGEFVTMLVKTLEIPTEEALSCTGYTDDIPQWLKPYLAAAIRAGLTAGLPQQQTFGADTPITVEEAGILLKNALDSAVQETFSREGSALLTRADAAQLLYRAAKAAQEQKIDTVI